MAKATRYIIVIDHLNLCVTFFFSFLMSHVLSVLSWKYTVWHISSLFMYLKIWCFCIEIKHLVPYNIDTEKNGQHQPVASMLHDTKIWATPARRVMCGATPLSHLQMGSVGGGNFPFVFILIYKMNTGTTMLNVLYIMMIITTLWCPCIMSIHLHLCNKITDWLTVVEYDWHGVYGNYLFSNWYELKNLEKCQRERERKYKLLKFSLSYFWSYCAIICVQWQRWSITFKTYTRTKTSGKLNNNQLVWWLCLL